MAARAVSRAQLLSARTVHIKMFPLARTLRERREVLRVIERFGEVTMFRSLKYHPVAPVPNAFIAMFQSDISARELIASGPIRYELVDDSSESLNNTAENQSLVGSRNTFELTINASFFDHGRAIRENVLHGPWLPMQASSPTRPAQSSLKSMCLQKILPESAWSSGLADWETAEMKFKKDSLDEQLDDHNEKTPFGKEFSKSFRAHERRKSTINIPAVMESLSQYSETYQDLNSGNSNK